MDLIYTTPARVDEGILSAYELDLAFGSGENDFELQAGTKHILSPGQYVYIEGTEYGGIIDAIESDTATKKVVYSGRSWHGILNSKVLMPPAGADYLILSGDANAVLANLITTLGLGSLFVAETVSSGIAITNYQMIRYIPAYNGILRMLKDNGAKLCMCYVGDMVKLAAQPITDYTASEDEFDSDILEFCAKKTVNKTNHLVCLGQGELAARTVLHLYADTAGNISTTQTITGTDELVAIYENTQCETAAELQAEGIKRFKELLDQDDITIDFNEAADDYSVGDIVGAVDNVTGIAVKTEIKKKIVKIKDGRITVDLDTTSGTTRTISGGSFNGEQSQGGSGVNLEAVFPVGSIYINETSTNPATLFGFGTWQQIEGQFLLGASSEYPAGTTGGSATHKHATQGHSLTIAQMPSHNHYLLRPRWGATAVGANAVYGSNGTGSGAEYDNNGYAGDNQPHDHGDTTDGSSMGPYIAVYIWRRTA
jgi:hypothetical protein